MHQQRRRKKRASHGLKTVDVTRGRNGYGFTISGQQPCILSCIVNGSPADKVGLKAGDYLISVNGHNISKASHDDVVRYIGSSSGVLTLQIAENFHSSDSSDEDYQANAKPKSKYPNRVRPRNAGHSNNRAEKVLADLHSGAIFPETNQRQQPKKPVTQVRARSQSPDSPDPEWYKESEKFTKKGLAQRNMQATHRIGLQEKRRAKHIGGPLSFRGSAVGQEGATGGHFNDDNARASAFVRPGHHSGRFKQEQQQQGNRGLGHADYLGLEMSMNQPQLQTVFTPQDLSNILYPSLQPHLGGSSQTLNQEDSLDDTQPTLRVIVGYIGSIEIPSDSNLPSARLQSIRSAVRRLRVEQKIHTLVLLEVFMAMVKLSNTIGATVAVYPADKLAFSGVCPDDKRFFGLVTFHSVNSDDISSDNGSQDDYATSSSCHVFMVDPELRAHNLHVQKARSFGIQCTVDPETHRCLEFPRSATPILKVVSKLYRERSGGLAEADVARANAFADPHHQGAPRSNSQSSNSDSGLGFGREEQGNGEPVYVVDMPIPRHQRWHSDSIASIEAVNNSMNTTIESQATQHSEPSSLGSPQNMNSSASSNDVTRSPSDRLNLRARPDPVGVKSPLSPDVLDSQSSAGDLRRSIYKMLQTRQKLTEYQSSSDADSHYSDITAQISSTPNQPPPQRPKSTPPTMTTTSASSLRAKMTNPIEDKLSPRAILPPKVPPRPIRKSLDDDVIFAKPPPPPKPTNLQRDKSSSASSVRSMVERFEGKPPLPVEDFEEVGKEAMFDRDQEEKEALEDSQISRRFSEGFALARTRESNKESHEQRRWSFRKGRLGKRTALSNSHESLVISDGDALHTSKLTTASSINSISKEPASDVGRAAGWAVGFDRLLNDRAGLATFTEFLKKEFSEENIVFWSTCEKFKKITDANERQTQAAVIYDRHLSMRAAEQVNVDSQARKDTEDRLSSPAPDMFNIPQRQIFQLMKHDSYARFLKSDLYRQCVVAEMEGKPLPFQGEAASPAKDDGKKLMKKSKSDSNAQEGGEEKRRISLLTWARNFHAGLLKDKGSKRVPKFGGGDGDKKSNKAAKGKGEKEGKEGAEEEGKPGPRRSSLASADLSLMSKEAITVKTEVQENKENMTKFCRVILPDNSTTVISTKAGWKIRDAMEKLCERRKLSLATIDVYLVGSEKTLDMNLDVATLGSKEIKIEKRVLFRMDLPNKKSIGVKAKPNRTIQDVFRPILHKYNIRLEDMVVHIAGIGVALDPETKVADIENQRIIVQSAQDFAEWGGYNSHRMSLGSKPPLPKGKVATDSLEEITNKVFDDLLDNKAAAAHNFDELGVLDPERKHEERVRNGEHRSSGLFAFMRRNSVGDKDADRARVKGKVTAATASQRILGTKRPHEPEDERLFELITSVQSQRFDDQRGLSAKDLELPEFLQTGNSVQENSGRPRSKSPGGPISPIGRRTSSSLGKSFSQPEGLNHLSSSGGEARSLSSFQTFGSPNSHPDLDSLQFADQSFSEDGVVPSHHAAEDYFNAPYQYPTAMDYNDSKLMDRSIADLGFGSHGSGVANCSSDKEFSSRTSSSLQQADIDPLSPRAFPVPKTPQSNYTSRDNSLLNETVVACGPGDLDDTLLAATPKPPPPPSALNRSIDDIAEANYPPPPPLTPRALKQLQDTEVYYRSSSAEDAGRSPYSRRFPRPELHHNTPKSILVKRQQPILLRENTSYDTDTTTDLEPSNCSGGTVNLTPPMSTPSPSTHELMVSPESPEPSVQQGMLGNVHFGTVPYRDRRSRKPVYLQPEHREGVKITFV